MSDKTSRIHNEMESEAKRLFDILDRHHDSKIGYVLYRCIYGDDEQWRLFVARLTAHVERCLTDPDEEDGHLLKNCWAFDIRENEAKLNGASKEEVCW